MKNEIPEIRIVPIEKLMLHEMEEPKRARRLEERIVSDGFLKNPVIVGRVTNDDSKFLLLDGVNRVSALKTLGFKDITVQIVDYFDQNVRVHAWCHLINDFDPQYLLEKIKEIENVDLEKTNRKSARTLLKQKKIVCYLFFQNKGIFIVKSKNDLKTRAAKLADVVNIYSNSSIVHRTSEAEAAFLLRKQKTATAVLTIPVYEKKDVLNLALNEVRLPSGVTRHILPSRALNLYVDLALLRCDMPLQDKNKLIQEMVNQRMVNGKTRFYRESVFVFDE